MVLKLVVNVMYIVGTVVNYDFEMWLQVVLIFAALFSSFMEPYANLRDNRLEQMTFLGIAAVISATKLGLAETLEEELSEEQATAWSMLRVPGMWLVVLVLVCMCTMFAHDYRTVSGQAMATQGENWT